MVKSLRQFAWGFATGVLLATFNMNLSAQVLHLSGQSIQPVYEGFEKNPDGTHTMWFGYLNRNYHEQPHIPVGDMNFFQVADGVTNAGPLDPSLVLDDPGALDRGQPTHFYPRRQQFIFGVTLPGDFTGKELVWTLATGGEIRTAVGTLEPDYVWGVDEGVWNANRGRGTGGRTDIEYNNQRPSIRTVGVEGEILATPGNPVTVRVFASDDGNPGPRERRQRPEIKPLPNNLPQTGGGIGRNSPKEQGVVHYSAADETGLAVTWTHFRGPGQVQFDQPVTTLDPTGAQVATSMSFNQPGTYVVRAYADDGTYNTPVDIKVVVQ